MAALITRRLGRTQRQVTTLGLGGQGSIQWPAEGVDPVAIIEKALDLGITYFDTSNLYGPSQENYGRAFRRKGLCPQTSNYDARFRQRIYVATKTHFRTARRPPGERFRTDFSEGMGAPFHVQGAVDDVRRSLSQMFGDGKGGYPSGAYLDCIQFHNLNTFDEIEMLFEGFHEPSAERPWMGALAAMLDLREGTNRSGCNPERERLVRHIGIAGHWSTATHIYAIQRDEQRVLDTLLVAINPSDGQYMAHRHNAIATARAADMGIVGMKVFADAAYYHKAPKFSSVPEDVYNKVGSPQLPSADLIRYPLSIPGICTVITGIGHIDADPGQCQLSDNLQAAQLESPLSDTQMKAIEQKVASAQKHGANSYFQRPEAGLGAPRNPGVERNTAMPLFGYNAVRVSWDGAYAGPADIKTYEVLRNGERIGAVPHVPQFTRKRFCYDDILKEKTDAGRNRYRVVAVDALGNRAATADLTTV